MRTDLRKQIKNDFKKDFCKLINNAIFGKIIENVRKYRDIKLFGVKTKLSYYKVFHGISISNRNEKKQNKTKQQQQQQKTQILRDKIVYLGLSILEFSKILMHAFWYDYVRPKYKEKEFFFIWIQAVLLFT